MTDQAAHLRRLSFHDLSTSPLPSVSVQTGRVSFAPQRPRPLPVEPPARLARAIAITSGKGGVGKTNMAVNLAVCMAQAGKRVCLLDADLGLANADMLCGLTPRVTLEDVVCRGRRLSETVLLGPGGFRLIPGASGVARLADLSPRQRAELLAQLLVVERVADVILIDTGAGLGTNVLAFAGAAASTVVVTTPEPTALTDAYAMVKTLSTRSPETQIQILVNQVKDRAEGESVFHRMSKVCGTFLRRQVAFAGWVPSDSTLPDSVRRRQPVTVLHPRSAATRQIRAIGRTLLGEAAPASDRGFFARLSSWMSGEERVR
jgi:flagellar biosynthesis protein FlhG